jgi:hypothetical protein
MTSRNDLPKLWITALLMSGVLPSRSVVFILSAILPIDCPLADSIRVQYAKKTRLVAMNGTGPALFLTHPSKSQSNGAATAAPKIDQTAMFTMIKSTTHAKNLSLHFARTSSFGCRGPWDDDIRDRSYRSDPNKLN